ncbi:hypothetical protein PAXRUDRAFT_29155 [Paxillus rubicundulus Ve08.2h10]|uniref:Helitron helicase-like domain-containing protein n=1 Tax=Paxillus rubicundulus Ve08.2h10 TaxID=930991 RepID=A0A0D0BT44_9AGAM|nr:hypothetical protein PAXRUDRAFT_29155 [Paxillus rubicundulus Ve08.2h10]
MVEAQGCGTLHCHMLLWLTGNPSPQVLWNRMDENVAFKQNVFLWLEDIISSKAEGEGDHHLDPQPVLQGIEEEYFQWAFREFVQQLAIECNLHVHNDTCDKHLWNGEAHGDTGSGQGAKALVYYVTE